MQTLATLLAETGALIAEHGTSCQDGPIHHLSAAVRPFAPGAAAALVDPADSEVARQRAFAVAARTALRLPPEEQAQLVRLMEAPNRDRVAA